MKRFWLVLLSLGLVLAFSASAMAVDVKFSGSFYAAGMYLDRTTLNSDRFMTAAAVNAVPGDATHNYTPGIPAQYQAAGTSTAFYYQRLRLQTDFIVSPGLKLVTRFDALERIWGGTRSVAGTPDAESIGTRAENENIAFDLAYVEYASPIGLFSVGYQIDNVWGTKFGDNGDGPTTGAIKYILPIGPVILGGVIYKEADLSKSAVQTSSLQADRDSDKYVAFGIYNITKDINVGLLYSYSRVATYKAAYMTTSPYAGAMIYVNTLQPYVKAKFGPLYVESEFWYVWGRYPGLEDPAYGGDVQLESIMGYVNAVVDLGPVYFGGTAAYISGDDKGTSEKKEGGLVGGGMDWNPCLIMFNQDLTYWAGSPNGYNGTNTQSVDGHGMTNAWFGQGKVGVRPIPPLDINASLSYARAESRPLNTITDKKAYGWEVDVAGTYKITNNLAYMLGVGYLFAGDYYKGYSDAPSPKDDFLVINKLTLTF